MSSLVSLAPRLSLKQAADLALELYGLQGTLEEMPSERDQNFLLRTGAGEEYVLKVANPTETRESLDFQNQAMAHLLDRAKGEPICPRVAPSLEGREMELREIAGGQHLIRLLTYLPGRPLALVRPHGRELMSGLGRFFGQVDAYLADFDHPAVHREFHWDLARAGEVVEAHSPKIPDPKRRSLVDFFLAGYRERTEPLLSGLPQGVLHNDGNDYNILVVPEGRWSNRVGAVIDFGDMVHSHLVNEPAIVCAYAMLDKRDPLQTAAWIAAGYNQVRPLSEEELAALYDLACMRLCASVCQAAHQAAQEPDNEYLRISERPAWELLARLREIHPHQAHYLLRQACGLEAFPGGDRIRVWLRANSASFVPPVEADLRGGETSFLDLGVDSPLLDLATGPGGPGALEAAVAAIAAGSPAKAALGRYGEPRLVYDSDDFKTETEELPETRTIHLGLDVFMAAGSPVRAFAAGRVHSMGDNTEPLDYGPAVILEHETSEGDTFHTLHGHLSRESLKGLTVGQRIVKGEVFAALGDSSVNGGWPPHLHFQLILDLLGQEGTFPGVARPGREDFWRALCPDPGPALGLDREAAGRPRAAARRNSWRAANAPSAPTCPSPTGNP